MDTERAVADHYAHSTLEQAVLDGLAQAGKDLAHLTPADLAPVDEFHIGGRPATIEFAEQMAVEPGWHLLDIGCGIGGASRYFAHERGCDVTGIDLTSDYVRSATLLSRLVGLESHVHYEQGSAANLPFAGAAFDGAYMLHVGMNIADKAALFAGVRRVLKPGGVFGIYDVMAGGGDGDGALAFPVPWASTPETSFVESPDNYRRHLEQADFQVEKLGDRREFAIAFFEQMRVRAAQSDGPAPLGLHIVMGPSAPQKISNMMDNLRRGLIAPVEIISRAT